MGKSMKFYTCGAYYPQRPLSREVGSWEHEVGKRSRDGGESMLRVRSRLQSPPEGEQASKPKWVRRIPLKRAWGEMPGRSLCSHQCQWKALVWPGFRNNWEKFRSGRFISIKENFLSGVVLAKWEIMTKALQRDFFLNNLTSENPLGSRTHHFQTTAPMSSSQLHPGKIPIVTTAIWQLYHAQWLNLQIKNLSDSCFMDTFVPLWHCFVYLSWAT